MRRLVVLSLVLTVLVSPLHAAETWYVQGDQTVLTEPRPDAETVASLPSLSRVTWLERQGGYVKVSASGKVQGWVRIFGLRSGVKKGGEGLDTLDGIVSMPLRKTDATRMVASVGVRGVMEEALRSNNVRIDEIIKMEMLAQRTRELPANKFWKRVETFKVEHLPEQPAAGEQDYE